MGRAPHNELIFAKDSRVTAVADAEVEQLQRKGTTLDQNMDQMLISV